MGNDDKDPHRILSRIFRSNKHNIESEFEEKIINMVGNYYYKFYKYRELDELTLENRD